MNFFEKFIRWFYGLFSAKFGVRFGVMCAFGFSAFVFIGLGAGGDGKLWHWIVAAISLALVAGFLVYGFKDQKQAEEEDDWWNRK